MNQRLKIEFHTKKIDFFSKKPLMVNQSTILFATVVWTGKHYDIFTTVDRTDTFTDSCTTAPRLAKVTASSTSAVSMVENIGVNLNKVSTIQNILKILDTKMVLLKIIQIQFKSNDRSSLQNSTSTKLSTRSSCYKKIKSIF